MYNYDEYIGLVDKFAEISADKNAKGYLCHTIIRDYYDKTGKTPLDYDDLDGTRLLLEQDQIRTKHTLMHYTRMLTKFNEFCYSQGIPVSDYTSEATFDINYILQHMKSGVEYYTDSDMVDMIQKQKTERNWHIAAFRSFYEGVVFSIREAYDLNISMVDFNTNTILTGSRVVKISSQLIDAYKYTSNQEEMILLNHQGEKTKSFKSPPGALIPSSSPNADNFINFLSRRFKQASDFYGRKIDRYSLYYSGFINYMLQSVSPEELANMFRDARTTKREVVFLKESAKNYNVEQKHEQLKRTLLPYIVAMERRYNNL